MKINSYKMLIPRQQSKVIHILTSSNLARAYNQTFYELNQRVFYFQQDFPNFDESFLFTLKKGVFWKTFETSDFFKKMDKDHRINLTKLEDNIALTLGGSNYNEPRSVQLIQKDLTL